MKRIIDYTIVASQTEFDTDFITDVKTKIKAGWQPIGGISSVAGYLEEDYDLLIQAMVKYEND